MLNFTTWSRRSRRARERGVAAVEFALIVPILMTIIIGIVEFGMAWNYRTQLNNATQIAARTYSIDRDWNVARANVTGMAPTANITRSITCTDATAGSAVTITTTVVRPTITNLFGTNFTYKAKGVARCN